MPLVATLLLGMSFISPTVTPFAFNKKAAFSLEFDDSMVSQIKNVLPLLAQYRFPATFYINPGRNDYDKAVWEKKVPAAGHELADHTMHHRDTVGAEQAASEIGDCAKVIEHVHGHPLLTVFGTPGGVKWEIPPDDFQRVLKENRLVFPGRMDFYQDGQGDITRFPKLALEKDVWRQLGMHGVGGQWLSTSVENLTNLLRFLDAHRDEIWVAPTGTVWKYQREREALNRLFVDPKGDGFRLTLGFDRTKLEPFELYDTPLTVFIFVPLEWQRAKVLIDGKSSVVPTSRGTAMIQVAPQARTVLIQKG
jgi:peptidoglycan/xylan/chitin deacetylase (PgdA/CDA1 family)